MSELSTVAEQERQEQSAPDGRRAGFVLGLDVGSSVIRCHVYDRAARICGSSAQKVTGERASGLRVSVAQDARDPIVGAERAGPPHPAWRPPPAAPPALGLDRSAGIGQGTAFPPGSD